MLYEAECTAVEDHHIFFGTANRRLSERYGMKVWLCPDHHRNGDYSPHRNIEADKLLKQTAQRVFENAHSREDFMRIFGKNYLD